MCTDARRFAREASRHFSDNRRVQHTWQIDHCANEPPDVELGCVSIGGDIYKVLLLDVRTAGGQRIARTLIIGFPAHALAHDYRARLRLHLVKASDDLRKDTGIEYMASHWE